MRENKYRVWDNKLKEYDYNAIAHQLKIIEATEEEYPTGEELADIGFYNSPRFTYEQFTCLKDKNSKEIYEGDILKSDDPEEHNTYIVIYEFSGFKKQIEGFSELSIFFTGRDEYDLIVIGNIHENPELLR